MTAQFALDLPYVSPPATSESSDNSFTVLSALVQSIIGDCDEETAYNRFATYAFFSSLLFTNAAKLFRGYLKHERFLRRDTKQRRRLLRTIRKRKALEKRFGLGEYIKRFETKSYARTTGEIHEEFHLEKAVERLQSALRESYCSTIATVKNISDTRPPFPPPHWAGAARPKNRNGDYLTRKLYTRFPDAGYLTRLVSQLGYDGHAAIAATVRAHTPWCCPPADRRRANAFNVDDQDEGKSYEYSSVASVRPYYPMSPILHTTSGGYRRETVTEAISKHNWDDKHCTAVFDILYLRREPFLVAASLGLRIGTVYNYCNRVRKDIQAGSK